MTSVLLLAAVFVFIFSGVVLSGLRWINRGER